VVDVDPEPGRFILTGSHQFELMTQVSQSLAGRTAVLRLLPFTLAEVQRLRGVGSAPDLAQTLLTGFYPRIHDRGLNPSQAMADYFATYVADGDLRQLAAVQDLQRFERFVRLCAGRTGQLLNLTSLGNDAGVSHVTARAWIDLLQSSYIVHLLPPWFGNAGKRLVKCPKLYFYDVGLACWLLGLRIADQVSRDPLWGSLFENFVIMEAMKDRLNDGETAEYTFTGILKATRSILLLPAGGKLHAMEIKAGATVNRDYFKGLKTFAAHQPSVFASGCVVFGGQEAQHRSDWPVHSWRQLQSKALVWLDHVHRHVHLCPGALTPSSTRWTRPLPRLRAPRRAIWVKKAGRTRPTDWSRRCTTRIRWKPCKP